PYDRGRGDDPAPRFRAAAAPRRFAAGSGRAVARAGPALGFCDWQDVGAADRAADPGVWGLSRLAEHRRAFRRRSRPARGANAWQAFGGARPAEPPATRYAGTVHGRPLPFAVRAPRAPP